MKLLHITYGFNGGGVGFVISNYCTERPFPNVHFDIVGEDIGKKHFLHDHFEAAGFNVHYVTPKKKSLLKNIKEMFGIIRAGHYDAVHVHFEEWSFLYLWIAKICKVPVRICHSHMAYMEGAADKIHYKLFRKLLNHFATTRIACSKDAGEHLFGKNKYIILKNAIEPEKFIFNQETRDKKRLELNLKNETVLGVVGRLSYQKNPLFTVDVFSEYLKLDPDSVLLFIGQGEMEDEVKSKVKDLKLTEKVRFLGFRDDVNELLQAMDIFVLPSRYEGLGIVYVEAQAAGLATFATADVVPAEACISDELFTFIPRDANSKEWADAMYRSDKVKREDMSRLVKLHGYDIHSEVSKLERIYLESIKG